MKIIVKRSTVLTIILINNKTQLIMVSNEIPTTFHQSNSFSTPEHIPCTHFRFRRSSIFIEAFKEGKFVLIILLSYYSARKASLR